MRAHDVKYIFEAILRASLSADLNVFFERNFKKSCFWLLAIYLHVKKHYVRCSLSCQLGVIRLVNWKDSFEKIDSEFDITKRKKQTLDSLHDAGRISQFTYECLNKGLTEEIEQTEAQRKALTEKMTRKLNELEEQRIALEMFLANTEIAYVAGDIAQEIYMKESSALDLGLEATKQELNWIKEVIIELVPKENEPPTTPSAAPVPVEITEASTTETAVEKTNETTSNVPVEVPVEVNPTTSEVNVEQIQVPPETPAPTQTTTNEGGEAPFREQGGNPTT